MIDFIKQIDPTIQVAIAEDWMWDTKAFDEEELYITRAVEKRKREFRAGRHSAHKVLGELGHTNFPLKVGNHRQPLWPSEVIGSISHTDGFCACVALPEGKASSIGFDVEPLSQVDRASLPLICTRKELEYVDKTQQGVEIPLCKLIFSAKECVHKAYYPLNEHTLDFLDAEISIDLTTSSFTATIINSEKNPKVPIKKLNGQFHHDTNYLYTLIVRN